MGRRRKITPTIDFCSGRVRARWTNDFGRQQLDLGPANRPEAWRAAHARLVAQLAGDPSAGPRQARDLLASELLAAWIASDDAAHLKDRTHHRRAALLFASQFAEVPASEVTPGAVEDWLNALARETEPVADGKPGTRRRQVYSISTIQKYLGTIKRAWRWAVRRGKLPAERWWELSSVTGPNPGLARAAAIRLPANPDHVAAILPHLRPPVRAIVELQELTGMRPSELFRLRPCDLLRTGKVSVEGVGLVDLDQLNIWVYVPPVRKTKLRWIVFGAKARKLLAPFLDRLADAPLFDPRESLADLRREQRAEREKRDGGSGGNRKPAAEQPRRRPGNAYTAGTFRRAVERACLAAGVPAFTPYQIRHLFAETARDEHGLDHAQAALGHTDPRTTQRYAKRSFKLAVEVAKKSG